MSFFKRPTFFLYLFQLENYYPFRFLKVSLKNIFNFNSERRQKLIWTKKAILLFVFSVLIFFIISFLPFLFFENFFISFAFFIILSAFLLFFFFIPLSLSYLFILPFDLFAKFLVISHARKKIASFSNLKIIGVTGSYGKTTMKEILFSILSEKFKVLKTPENFNTPLGVSNFILSSLSADIEVLIVEMGAYKIGDIKKLCRLAPPDIAVITGINESHLERFKKIENTVKAKFEIVENSKPKAQIVLNVDNDLIVSNYKEYLKNRPVAFYTASRHYLAKYQIKNFVFLPDGTGLRFSLMNPKGEIGPFQVNLLAEYATGSFSAAALIAENLGLTSAEILHGASKVKPVSHRLEPLRNPNGVLIIDDSYNGNPAGVKEALRVLARLAPRRRIYITPGLVETGKEAERIHKEIGFELAAVAQIIILIKTSVTPFIKQALLERHFPENNIKEFSSMKEVEAALPQIVNSGDVVLFQNDWPDNYS